MYPFHELNGKNKQKPRKQVNQQELPYSICVNNFDCGSAQDLFVNQPLGGNAS